MQLSASSRKLIVVSSLMAIIGMAMWVTPAAALPAYATATGQACGVCHVNPAGGGPRTALGQKFEAIPTHATDPAGAFAQASAPVTAAPTTAPAVPTAAPTTAAQPTAAPTSAAAPTAAPTAAAKPTAAPAASATPTVTALPRTGDSPSFLILALAAVALTCVGWLIRRTVIAR